MSEDAEYPHPVLFVLAVFLVVALLIPARPKPELQSLQPTAPACTELNAN